MSRDQTVLQELLNSMQSLQSAQEEETQRLRRRLTWLEGRRREFYEILAQSGSDFESRRKLEETEQQLEQMQEMLARTESELREALADVRGRIITLRNEELARLEREAKLLRARRDEIHGTLLPEAKSRVTALQEEEDRTVQRTEEIARRIRELNQIDLPTTQVA